MSPLTPIQPTAITILPADTPPAALTSVNPLVTPPRLHGFQPPFQPLQVCSWFIFSFFAIVTNAIVLPFVQQVAHLRAAAYAVYNVLLLLTVASTVYTTATSTVDSSHLLPPSAVDNDQYTYCDYCQKVVSMESKHCRRCNRCTPCFDHHCNWIGTDVAMSNNHSVSKHGNYIAFTVMIWSIGAMMTLQTAVCMDALVLTFGYAEYRQHGLLVFGTYVSYIQTSTSLVAVQVVIIIQLVLTLPLLVSILQLIGIHLMLRWRGLTTYDWIGLQREEEKARVEQSLTSSAGSSKKRQRRQSQKSNKVKPSAVASFVTTQQSSPPYMLENQSVSYTMQSAVTVNSSVQTPHESDVLYRQSSTMTDSTLKSIMPVDVVYKADTGVSTDKQLHEQLHVG